jgi:cytochrome c-type biogenesis protein CcmH/NrfG
MKILILTIICLMVANIYGNDSNAQLKHTVTPAEAKLLERANSVASTNYLAAATFLSSQLSQNSSSPMLFAIGNFYFKANEYKAAKRLYLDTLKKSPDYIDVKKNLARLYLTTEEFDKAKVVMIELISSDPTNPDYYLFLGNAYMLSNFDTPAETAFRQCLMIDPTNSSAKLGLCKSLLNQEKYQEVTPIAKELLDLNANSQVYWMLLANVQIAEGEITDALYSLETAKRLQCTTQEMEMTLANIYLNQNLAKNAIDIYIKLLENPNNFDAEQLKKIINVLISMGEIDLAEKLYNNSESNKILKKEESLKLKASIHIAKQEQKEAIEIYKQILELNPIEAETLIAYATYLKDKQLYEQAITTIKPVTRLKGHEAAALLLLTDIELERRNFQAAVNYLENAMIFENNPATENYLRQIKKLLN